MKKLNIKRFATSNPDTFEMYTHYTENYDTFGNCTSVTVSTVASLDIVQITKNGVDVSSEWSNVPSPYISKEYTSNITETLTFYGSNGQEYVETINIISVNANPIIPPEFYASDANIKINSDVKVGKMSLKEIDDTVSALFDLIYPVGSIYYTNNANFSPNVSFNGTWEQIKDDTIVAYAEMSGTTLNQSKNISSITGSSTFTVTFSKTMANTKYKVFVSGECSGLGAEIIGVYGKTTTGFKFDFCNYSGTATTPTSQNILVIGQLANPEYYEWKRVS